MTKPSLSDDELAERLREADARAAFAVYGAIGTMERFRRASAEAAVAAEDLGRALRVFLRDQYEAAGYPYGDTEEGLRRWSNEQGVDEDENPEASTAEDGDAEG
jgi:hypothetical protein